MENKTDRSKKDQVTKQSGTDSKPNAVNPTNATTPAHSKPASAPKGEPDYNIKDESGKKIVDQDL